MSCGRSELKNKTQLNQKNHHTSELLKKKASSGTKPRAMRKVAYLPACFFSFFKKKVSVFFQISNTTSINLSYSTKMDKKVSLLQPLRESSIILTTPLPPFGTSFHGIRALVNPVIQNSVPNLPTVLKWSYRRDHLLTTLFRFKTQHFHNGNMNSLKYVKMLSVI